MNPQSIYEHQELLDDVIEALECYNDCSDREELDFMNELLAIEAIEAELLKA